MASSDSKTNSSFKSQLATRPERYLSHAIVYALENGWRTPEDFLRHFKPFDLMKGLEANIELRVHVLVGTIGTNEKIARKKSTGSSAEDLGIAIEEGVTTSAKVLSLFPPDDRVRYLDAGKLWGFLTEDEFWLAGNDRAVDRMLFMLESALADGLLTLQDVTDGVSYESIAEHLPPEALKKLLVHALKRARKSNPLSEEALLEIVPFAALVRTIPLDLFWNQVIVAKIAKPSGFVGGWVGSKPARLSEVRTAGATQTKPESAPEFLPPPAPVITPASVRPPPPPPPPLVSAPLHATAPLPPPPAVPREEPAQTRAADEEGVRSQAVERLRSISRLPVQYASLSTPILTSLESLYEALLTASNDEQRETCIRAAFPSPNQLAVAMLALIEVLDPTIQVNDPVIRDAGADALLKIVIFEERQRYEQAHPENRPSSASMLAPPPSIRRSSNSPRPEPKRR